jgi:hypothetical protein
MKLRRSLHESQYIKVTQAIMALILNNSNEFKARAAGSIKPREDFIAEGEDKKCRLDLPKITIAFQKCT